jgi:hypothetical protein
MTKIQFISLGDGCAIGFNINKFLKQTSDGQPTLFFDWLRTSYFKHVCEILDASNIDDILNLNNIYTTYGIAHSVVNFKAQKGLLARHDIPSVHTENDLIEFFTKYKRRRQRIIDMIINNDNNIIFLRMGSITHEEFELFDKIILKINPQCKYKIISLENSVKDDIEINSKFMIIQLQNYLLKPFNLEDWTRASVDWNRIFLNLGKTWVNE